MAAAPKRVVFYRPGRSFPSFSVTGGACALGCDYCRGRYLQGMTPVRDGQDLVRRAVELEGAGGRGLLLSGGCDPAGKVPLAGFLPAVRRIKDQTRLQVNLHAGLVDLEQEARALAQSGADCLSVDVVQDPAVLREVMHLDRGPEDYRRTLELLLRAGARVVPHICIGVGSEPAEERAVRLVAGMPVSGIVMLTFMPAPGTPMHRSPPASRERVMRALRLALDQARAPVLVGCMRPRGDWRLEVECIEAGVAGMAMPARRTAEWAAANGHQVIWEEGCCALHR